MVLVLLPSIVLVLPLLQLPVAFARSVHCSFLMYFLLLPPVLPLVLLLVLLSSHTDTA